MPSTNPALRLCVLQCRNHLITPIGMPLLHETDGPSLPRLPAALLRALLPFAERDEVLADIRAEYAEICARSGRATATRWVWRQALRSAPRLLGWNWWRGWSGF